MKARYNPVYAGRALMVGAELIAGTIEDLDDSGGLVLDTAAGRTLTLTLECALSACNPVVRSDDRQAYALKRAAGFSRRPFSSVYRDSCADRPSPWAADEWLHPSTGSELVNLFKPLRSARFMAPHEENKKRFTTETQRHRDREKATIPLHHIEVNNFLLQKPAREGTKTPTPLCLCASVVIFLFARETGRLPIDSLALGMGPLAGDFARPAAAGARINDTMLTYYIPGSLLCMHIIYPN